MMKINLDSGELQVQSPDWEFFSSDHLDVNSMFPSPARNPFQQSSLILDGTQSLSSNHIGKPQTPMISWMLSDNKPSEALQQDIVEFLNFENEKSENQQAIERMMQDQLLGKSQTFEGASAEGTSLQGQSCIGNDQMFVEMNETGQGVFLRKTLPLEQQQQQELNLQGLMTELPLLELQQQQQMYVNQNIMSPQLANSHQVHEEQQSLQLVQLLLICGEAVAKQDFELANKYLQHLKFMASPLGNPMQRVAAWFMEALNTLLAKPSNTETNPITRIMSTLPPEPNEILTIYQVFYQTCPYVKFAHFTCNQMILEAFQGEDQVHIIDLHIIQGFQWVTLMEALANRPGGPPSLKITGIGMFVGCVRETGRRLAELARFLHIPFEFHAIGAGLHELKPHMFTRKIGEALAVNCINCLHRVPNDTLGKLVLTMIRDQAPNVVTIIEPEANHDGPYFLGRFLEALHYYSAVFDSLNETFLPDQSVDRAKVEKYLFAPEIQDIVAYEGKERELRHRRVHRWRKLMEGKGFKGLPFSPNAVSQAVTLLGMYSCDGYRLMEEKGCLILGWQDRAVLAASAWRC